MVSFARTLTKFGRFALQQVDFTDRWRWLRHRQASTALQCGIRTPSVALAVAPAAVAREPRQHGRALLIKSVPFSNTRSAVTVLFILLVATMGMWTP